MLKNINDDSFQGRVNHSEAYLIFKPQLPLSDWVQAFWQLNVPNGKYFYRSVPDNCVDLIINLNSPEDAFIVTPFSTAKVFEMLGPVSYFGIRFRILGHQGIIKAPLGEWRHDESIVSLNDLLPRQILNSLYQNAYQIMPFHQRCHFLSQMLLEGLGDSEIDKRLINFVLYCDSDLTSSADLSDKQCAKFGVSARHLRRLTSLHLGLTPRAFAKVFRFQRALKSMTVEADANVWANFYYDQPHFNRDFKLMSGVTPSEFRNMSVLYNTD